MHITVYTAYIALHTACIYHSSRASYHIQARIRSNVYAAHTHKRRSTDALCPAKPEKVRIQGDAIRAIYGISPPPYYQKT